MDWSELFRLDDPPLSRDWPVTNEFELVDGQGDTAYRSYSQQQKCLIYTREQARQWFALRHDYAGFETNHSVVCHRRVGDYPGYGYPVVSKASYDKALLTRLGIESAHFCTEENSTHDSRWCRDCQFVPDFLTMMRAKTLLRETPVLAGGRDTREWHRVQPGH